MSAGNYIDCVLIDVENGGSIHVLRHFEDTLQALYEKLNCSTIDIVSRFCYICGKRIEFVVDDEGLYVDKPEPSVVFYSVPHAMTGKHDISEVFVGNTIIAGCANEEGELTSLSDEDIEGILEHFRRVKYKDGSSSNVFVCPTRY